MCIYSVIAYVESMSKEVKVTMITGRNNLISPFTGFALVAFFFSIINIDLYAATVPAGITNDVQYGIVEGEKLLLDAFVPAEGDLHPIVILVHGGGWVGGDKQDMSLLYHSLIESDFTWFSINYRLAPQFRWPACLDDVQTAIQWVKAHANEYKGDPNKIALVGYSAGGHLACMAAIREPVQAVVGLAAPVDHLSDSNRRGGASECMQKLLDCQAEIDSNVKKKLNDISPINYLTAELPPFLLIHGTADRSVPYSQSINFQAGLKKLNVPCDLITIKEAPHRITEWNNSGEDFRPAFAQWLSKTLTKSKLSGADLQCKTITVSQDGKGDFKSVQAAIDSVQDYSEQKTVIEIEPGIYKEKIVIPRSKRNIYLKGKNAHKTVLTYDLYAGIKDANGKEIGTFRTPSVTIEADDITAEKITFENSAGDVGQAVAMAVLGDRIVFRDCRFLGWQDTLLDQSGRHYYENCYIDGHCDFIFGGGTAFFEKCHIHCLSASYITAASTPEHQKYGYIFSNCKITGEPEKSEVYLGRPWRDYAYVLFMNCNMADMIRSQGWHNWSKPHREKTSRYYEYNNTGPGANLKGRVSWSRLLTDEQVQEITISNVLAGDDGWNPLTGEYEPSVTLVGDHAENRVLVDRIKKNEKMYLSVNASSDFSDGLQLAYSYDGFKWSKLTGSLLTSQVGKQKKMRDASILQSQDGTFYLVWQAGDRPDCGFGYASSKDLVHWSNQKYIDLMSEHKAYDLTNPHIYYDKQQKRYIITWASTLPGNYYQSYQEEVDNNPRIWFTSTEDFETFAPAENFIEPGYRIDDALIVKSDDRYVLIHEDSRKNYRTLRFGFSDSPTGPWSEYTDGLTCDSVSSPVVFEEDDRYVVYCKKDSGGYNAYITGDFRVCNDISDLISVPAGVQLGDIVKVDNGTLQQLIANAGKAAAKNNDQALDVIEPIDAPFPMPELKRPVFPGNTVDIRDYGAVADGKTYNTKAFADAIKACVEIGGGRVLVPEGKWFTGPIHLASNIDLHLAKGAEIIFSDRCEDYLPVVLVRVGGVEIYNYSPLIYARDCENIAITGPGKLNGNANAWWTMKGKETGDFFEMAAQGVPVEERVFGTRQAGIRPSFLCLSGCKNILLEGFTIGSGPNWTIHPIYCDNIIIRKVNVITDGPNNDGIDPDSCRNVLIEHCLFDTGDDCVVLKSGYNEDGWRVGRPTENVVMRYCSSKRGHGGLVIGSEMSGDVRNVYMHDCEFEGTDRAVRIKSKRGRGGVVENIWAKDLILNNMQREAVILNMVYGSDRKNISNEKAPKFRNIHISNLTCQGAPTAILMRALDDSPIEDVTLENIKITSQKGIICENVKGIVFENVSVVPQKGPVYQFYNGVDLMISKNTVAEGTEVFLEVTGESSADIVIRDTDVSKATQVVSVKDGADKAAVKFE